MKLNILITLAVILSIHLDQSLGLPAVNTVCPPNSSFSRCITRCPVTCANYLNPPKGCVRLCSTGCSCHDGYLKFDKGPYSTCVRPFECDKFGFGKQLKQI